MPAATIVSSKGRASPTPAVPAVPLRARWIVVPLLIAIVLIAIDHTTDMDRTLTRWAYDAQTRTFPLRTAFWLDVVMHHWTKDVVITLGGLLAAALVVSSILPVLSGQRLVLLFVVLAMSLAPLAVTLAKSVSARHCPWDIDEFGGLVPYTRMFEPAVPDSPAGHCFPAGHASTGFALLALYFAAYANGRKKAARIALAVGLGAGLALGFGRVLQGAHFPSHVLWSGLLCWVVMVLLYRLVLRKKLGSDANFLKGSERARRPS